MRRMPRTLAAAIGISLLIAAIGPGATSAASASRWRATLAGGGMTGGATTLIDAATGIVSVKVYGAGAGATPLVRLVGAACGAAGDLLASGFIGRGDASGTATGVVRLTAGQVAAFNAAITAHRTVSVRAVVGARITCGDEVGAPRVVGAVLAGTLDDVGADYRIRYPVISGLDAAIQDPINSVLQGAAHAMLTRFAGDATSGGPPDEGMAGSHFQTTFATSLSRSDLLSLAIYASEYITGAAHPVGAIETHTFDLQTGAALGLADLFRPRTAYLALLSTESRSRLRALLDDPVLDDFIDDGTTPVAANFEGWMLTTAGLRMTFQPYQVAPYAVGMPAITIPWATLRPLLDLGGPIARLVPAGACLATQLRAASSAWDAGAGSRFNTVTLTNTSASTCWLRGTPRSQLVDATGRVLLDSAVDGAAGLPHVSAGDPKITLAPGVPAQTDIRTTNYCGRAPMEPVTISLWLPSDGGRVRTGPPASGSGLDGVPPCFGPGTPGHIETNGWRAV